MILNLQAAALNARPYNPSPRFRREGARLPVASRDMSDRPVTADPTGSLDEKCAWLRERMQARKGKR
jgi:hypothetical protein